MQENLISICSEYMRRYNYCVITFKIQLYGQDSLSININLSSFYFVHISNGNYLCFGRSNDKLIECVILEVTILSNSHEQFFD